MRIGEIILLFISSIPAALVVGIYAVNSPYDHITTKNAKAYHEISKSVKTSQINSIGVTNIPHPTSAPIPTRVPITSTPIPQAASDNDWGVAKQIDEHTYTIKIDYDGSMASGQEILQALNAYRQTHGKGALSWDQKLADYAQQRADLFRSIGNTDTHAGFNNFLTNEDGFSKLGYNRLGENSYFGGPLTGTHIIEWVFAKSPGHNANQLDDWTHAGIGINETAVNLNFGAN